MTAAATKVSTTHATRWTSSAVVQLLRSKVNRRASSYTTGVISDQMNEIETLQASNCPHLSGVPMEAIYTCAPVALSNASTVHNTKPMAQTRTHCLTMVSYLFCVQTPKNEDELHRQCHRRTAAAKVP